MPAASSAPPEFDPTRLDAFLRSALPGRTEGRMAIERISGGAGDGDLDDAGLDRLHGLRGAAAADRADATAPGCPAGRDGQQPDDQTDANPRHDA